MADTLSQSLVGQFLCRVRMASLDARSSRRCKADYLGARLAPESNSDPSDASRHKHRQPFLALLVAPLLVEGLSEYRSLSRRAEIEIGA
jgi:hypothetical protein